MVETDEMEWPPHLEALVAAPANHRLLHEDDEVRVLEVTVEPGERENLHHHRWPSNHARARPPDCHRQDLLPGRESVGRLPSPRTRRSACSRRSSVLGSNFVHSWARMVFASDPTNNTLCSRKRRTSSATSASADETRSAMAAIAIRCASLTPRTLSLNSSV
jgi:hypothetical protein